ncbi:MAG: ABC-type transport auxiliary lipoprotein family protein [Thiohalobacterales bacterium]|nr:ABC-type transport auxiliary lipoprotein family protein [Thiohalobacterales bacterium]
MKLRPVGLAVLLLVLVFTAGCAMLPEPKQAVLNKYLIEYTAEGTTGGYREGIPAVIVSIPRAHGGYDTARIAYKQQQHGLRYFAMSRWADTPARMLAPLMAEALNGSGAFQALYARPGSLSADYRLDSELIRLHQDFTRQPSEVRVTLRARLISLRDNRMLAARTFDVTEAADSEDAYGGVQATNRAVGRLLGELARFCAAQMSQ